ncbi:MAG: RNA ligase family protein [Sneathiellales bacterium]|nr:RNA ligase family protein [Sneathiellales bacterium]
MNTKPVKYPRTPHLPWSPGRTSDDVGIKTADQFTGKKVIVTEKMDGENTSLYPDRMHARSLDSAHHPSRDWVKGLHAKIAWQIPDGWRICGENLYARHSIGYEGLPSYFLAFSVWNEKNRCLSWRDTVQFCEQLGLHFPRILYDGDWDEAFIRSIKVDEGISEGYVVRTAGDFAYEDFGQNLAKWVRPSHVTSEKHWSKSELIPNGMVAIS